MKSAYSTARRGLTLLELVVVLAILAALAGLLLPLAGRYLEKAHAAAGADNIKEIAKAVQQYNAVTRAYPNQLDSLCSDVDAGTPFASLPGGGTYLADVQLTADQVSALQAVGITTVMEHGGTGSATFGSTVSPAVGLGIGDSVLTALPADVLAELGYTSDTAGTPVFAVLGFGHDTPIIGEWIQEAPFHFPEQGNPNLVYCRYALVFDISEDDNGGAANGDARAKFVGVVALHADGIGGQLGHVEEFFE